MWRNIDRLLIKLARPRFSSNNRSNVISFRLSWIVSKADPSASAETPYVIESDKVVGFSKITNDAQRSSDSTPVHTIYTRLRTSIICYRSCRGKEMTEWSIDRKRLIETYVRSYIKPSLDSLHSIKRSRVDRLIIFSGMHGNTIVNAMCLSRTILSNNV